MNYKPKTDILWAPWRMDYILADKVDECIFCSKTKEQDDQNNLILVRGEFNFVIMNKYPYNNGHLMVVPYRHTDSLETLNGDERLELMDMVSNSIKILRETIQPDGFNVGVNLGKVAGAGIDDHIHFHIVPRWAADTNFMPVVGQTKVVSEALAQTWNKLHQKFLANSK
ncbi:MAG: HIT domain-containing protein [bacterium]